MTLFFYRISIRLSLCCFITTILSYSHYSNCWGFVTSTPNVVVSLGKRRDTANDVASSSGTFQQVQSRQVVLLLRNNDHDHHLDDDDDDEEDDDDDEPPDVDVSQFKAPTAAYGLLSGRSSPSQRKGMGLARSSNAKVWLCTQCGSEFVKWMGKCPTCRQWNTLQEHIVTRQEQSSSAAYPWFGTDDTNINAVHHPATSWLAANEEQRTPTRLSQLLRNNDKEKNSNDNNPRRRRRRVCIPDDEEFNNVLGGGFFPGSLILVGGSPGVGKSTLLLRVAASLAALATPTPGIGMGPKTVADNDYGPVWYVSGEETPEQISARASRLSVHDETLLELYIWQETHADRLCQQVVQAAHNQRPHDNSATRDDDSLASTQQQQQQKTAPMLMIVDSIQTMVCNAGGASAAGGITQVRECVGLFLRLAKSTGIPIVLVGHVTKSGNVAGPRTVEHMVDCVLYLEGGGGEGSPLGGLHQIRMLRANKNRFGSTDEVGVYEMTAGRLQPVSDPSSLFMAHRSLMMNDVEGCAVCIALEGRRAVTMEVQALVTMGTEKFSRKTVDGIPVSRVQLLLGVLTKRCGLFFSRQDIYLNIVAGQMRLDRSQANAADLAVSVALVSSLTQIPVRADTAFCGEVGLLGELRSVVSLEKRVKEAKRMGFSRVITAIDRSSAGNRSKNNWKTYTTNNSLGIEWIQCETLKEALNLALVDPLPKRKLRKKKEASDTLAIPGSMEELGLDEIMDDEEDEDNFL